MSGADNPGYPLAPPNKLPKRDDTPTPPDMDTGQMMAKMLQQMQDMQATMERQNDALQAAHEQNTALQLQLAEAQGQRSARSRVPRGENMTEEQRWKVAESDGGLLG